MGFRHEYSNQTMKVRITSKDAGEPHRFRKNRKKYIGKYGKGKKDTGGKQKKCVQKKESNDEKGPGLRSKR